PAVLFCLGLGTLAIITGSCVLGYYYVRYARLIGRRLSGPIFAHTSKIYAAPEPVFVGQDATISDLIGRLRRSGYSEAKTNRTGWYQTVRGGLEIFPGPDSYFQDDPALLRLNGSKIERIISLRDNTEQQQYELEPELITNLFDR